MALVYIALGANLDEPLQQLNHASKALAKLAEGDSLKLSPFYRSVPMGDIPQAEYFNAVASLRTSLSPIALLDALQAIELAQGRQRLVRWGPRTLDLDLLLYDNLCLDTDRLILPHYGMKQRSFVLVPLFDIAPELTLPCQTPLRELITPAMRDELQIHLQ
ncbi:2-amino-4-hydroxy-6-hydroxymethyldihydropteridine pyrophosphokinase [Shewanella denitrificans OS217]|jgi:2-amino-4-hydroxy-6-hydroxymethyldihydropteridine diphosphokinase|uniref:2-amino-4-hydroxy-6-hydroxymethyldihydropteridine pyrophosphokinase n=1 Tax=Shewanella denitrificans (strain OS217 / ATCC BAA-1090 / DSM 15013) TaxID=318161 RepID=Q12JC7_SHEDO|nr:2-amino-4-hydroxy-6-hydroxymethyldihydropteridine diphosphokinase [Shewanella denitrificans]ABE56449.1 2-amino-4-hydroxy-6-hydroxymethyldihydropteridine pyrophosphokinase [Shewanella denitrificans OS217]